MSLPFHPLIMSTTYKKAPHLHHRTAGVLLHPTSLWNLSPIGDLGPAAYALYFFAGATPHPPTARFKTPWRGSRQSHCCPQFVYAICLLQDSTALRNWKGFFASRRKTSSPSRLTDFVNQPESTCSFQLNTLVTLTLSSLGLTVIRGTWGDWEKASQLRIRSSYWRFITCALDLTEVAR